MDKNQFLQAIRSFTEVSIEEAKELCALREKYPYSQILHALAARLSKDHNLPSHQHDLQMAAVYSGDRSVLKEVMSKAPEVWPASQEVIGQNHSDAPSSIAVASPEISEEKSVQDLADKVMQDLRTLSIAKNNFENMVEEGNVIPYHHSVDKPTDSVDHETRRKLPPGRKPGNVKAHKIVELVKALEHEAEEQDDAQGNGSHRNEDIIESIKSSKKKINPESEKQREQIQIIDEFIKTQPSISPAKHRDLTDQDFNTIKSGEFGEHVISETLVDILLRQGKKEKAIEVLRKLIWKFPQKKTYFAAQIEELKK